MTKTLAIVLVVVMCLGMMPVGIFAADTVACYYCQSTNVTFKQEIEATCTESGGKLYFCNDCQENFISDFVAALGHAEKVETPAKDATCTEEGATAQVVCSRCNIVLKASEVVEKLKHNITTTTTPPVCGVSDGLKIEDCANCDYHVETLLPKDEHSWKFVKGENINCVEADGEKTGKAYFACEHCGAEKVLDVVDYEHVFGNWEIVTEPTCAADGLKKCTCIHCGEVKTEKLDALKHTYDNGVVTTEPTCTAPGVKTFTCSGCGDSYTEPVSQLAHTKQFVDAVEGTCTTPGAKAHYKCETCDTLWADANDETTVITAEEIALAYEYDFGEFGKESSAYNHTFYYSQKLGGTACGTIATHVWACDCGTTRSFQVEVTHKEVLAATAANDETCGTAGNSAYWYCAACDKYFSDEAGTIEIAKDSWVIAATNHAGYTSVGATEANCGVDGNSAYVYCAACDKYFADNTFATEIAKDSWVIAATGAHTFTTYVVTTLPTCSAKGVKEAICDVCGVAKDTQEVDVVVDAHNYVKAGEAKNDLKGCVDEIVTTYTCEYCGDSYDVKADDPHHNFDDVYDVERYPSCDEDGIDYRRCTACGEYELDEKGQPVPHVTTARGHKWGNGEIIVEDTCLTVGTIEYTCTVCGDKKTENVDVIANHDYTGVVGVLKSEATCAAKAVYTYKCNECGETVDREEGDVTTNHTYDEGVITTTPTCTTEGVKTFTCSVCNGTKTDAVEMLAHTTTKTDAVEDTCTTAGCAEYWTCSVCNKTFADEAATTEVDVKDLVIDLISDHSYLATANATFEKDEDCTEYGYYYMQCEHCGDDYLVAIAPWGHTVVTDAKVEPDCTTEGKTEGSHCSVCKEVLVAQQTIPAIGNHVNADGKEISDDCTNAENTAITDRVCARCHETISFEHDEEIIKINANCSAFEYNLVQCKKCHIVITKEITGNEYGDCVFGTELVVDTAPTCTVAGAGHYVCTLCGKSSDSVVIPATDHSYGAPVVVDPKCGVEGTSTVTCAACGDTEVTPIPALEHVYVVDTAACVAPTYIATGLKVEKCTLCGDVKETVVPALTAVNFKVDYKNGNKNGAEYNVVNGGIVEVIISMEAFDIDATNVLFSFTYDANVLTFINATGNNAVFDEIDGFGDDKTGIFTLFANNKDGSVDKINGTTEVMVARFKVAALENIFVDEVGNVYESALKNFKATVYGAESAPVNVATPEVVNVEIHRLGAVSNDNYIDGADVSAVKEMIKADGYAAEADVDMDGDVDMDDYLYIIQYLIHKYTYAEFVGVSGK